MKQDQNIKAKRVTDAAAGVDSAEIEKPIEDWTILPNIN